MPWKSIAFQYLPTTNRKFSKTIEILQGDIEALENEKSGLEKRLEHQTKKTTSRRSLGGRASPYTSPYHSPFASPFIARRGVQAAAGGPVGVEGGGSAMVATVEEGAEGDAQQAMVPDSPLLLAKVGFSISLSVTEIMMYLYVCVCVCMHICIM